MEVIDLLPEVAVDESVRFGGVRALQAPDGGVS